MLVFFDLLSTNVTSFFRDRPHFDFLEREFYTGLARGNTTTSGRRIRIYSKFTSVSRKPRWPPVSNRSFAPGIRTSRWRVAAMSPLKRSANSCNPMSSSTLE